MLGLLLASLSILVAFESSRLIGKNFPGFLIWDNGYLVSFHDAHWTGPGAGLPLNGGRAVAVDDSPFVGGAALLEYAEQTPSRGHITYDVIYEDKSSRFIVPTMTMDRWDYATTFGVYLFNAIICFAIGVVAIFLSPSHRQVRAFAGSIILLGLVLLLAIDHNTTFHFVHLYQIAEGLLPASVMAFGLVFPINLLSERRRKLVVGSMYSVGLAIGIANAAYFYSSPQIARFFTNVSSTWIAIAGTFLPSVFAYSIFRANTERKRVQAAVVFTGALVAFAFGAVGLVSFFLLGSTFSFAWVVAPLFLFPLTVLYAILRHDLFEAERFIRITLGYTFATATVALAYAGGVSALEFWLEPGVFQGPGRSFIFLIVLAVAFEPIRQSVQRGIDRAFYRTVLDVGRELNESSLEIAALTSATAVCQQFEDRIRQALNVEWTRMQETKDLEGNAALQERVAYRDELLGWLAIGPKLSGAPFSQSERELVHGMAAQTALALRNLKSLQDLRDAQDSLVRAERLAVIGEFSQAIAHGIRNPLASIRAAAQIAGTRATDARVTSPLSDVIQQADRLDHRVRALLDYSRPFEPRYRIVDLAALLGGARQSLSSQAERIGVQITVSILPTPDIRVSSDADLLSEALLELSANALRAMPDGGELSLAAKISDRVLTLRVSDTGIGIAEHQRERILEPFFTTDADGTGLGLAAVRKIAESLGGSFYLDLSDERGTTFRLDMPIQTPPPME